MDCQLNAYNHIKANILVCKFKIDHFHNRFSTFYRRIQILSKIWRNIYLYIWNIHGIKSTLSKYVWKYLFTKFMRIWKKLQIKKSLIYRHSEFKLLNLNKWVCWINSRFTSICIDSIVELLYWKTHSSKNIKRFPYT